MALSQKHRIALYEHFAPQLGEDVTEALLAELPAHEGDELVTKTFLRAELAELREEMAELRGDLRSEMADLRAELRGDLRTEVGDLRSDMGDLRSDMGDLRSDLRSDMGDLRGDLRSEMQRLHNQTLTTIIAVASVMTAVLAIFN
jgi:hypothetical protein